MRVMSRGVTGISVLALAVTGLLGGPVQTARAADACNSTAGMTLGPGADAFISIQTRQTTAKSETLAGVIKWRQDALNDPNIKWGGMTVRQYLAANGISEASYLNPQWSYAMERIAIQRAVEAYDNNLHHTRPNGGGANTVLYNGTSTNSEVLAWGTNMTYTSAIDAFAGEKADYINKTNGTVTGVTSHYEWLINPQLLAYGMGEGTWIGGGNSFAGHASVRPSTDTSTTAWNALCEFKVPISAANLNGTLTWSPTAMNVGQTLPVTVTTSYQNRGYELRGTLSSANTAIATITQPNLSNATPGAVTGVSAGTTTLSLVTGTESFSSPLTVNGLQVVAATPVAVSTVAGTAPVLPSTVQVTYVDGSTGTEPVVWDAIPATSYAAPGTFTVVGTVGGQRIATATVTVTPAPLTITSVQAPAPVTTPSGTAPTLPTTVQVTWSDGTTTMEPVSWSAIDPALYTSRQGGTFTVTGSVAGYPAGTSIQVTVLPATPVSVQQAAPVTTVQGVAPTLPATLQVTWSNGDVTTETATWNAISPASYAQPGQFTVDGTLTNWPSPISVQVNVVAATITSVQPAEVTTPSGTKPVLPTTVTANLNNGQTMQIPVTWSSFPDALWMARLGGTFTVSGTSPSYSGPIELIVHVTPATAVKAAPLPDIHTASGTEPALAATTQVTWSNGEVTTEPITWDSYPVSTWSPRSGGTVVATGTVAGLRTSQTVIIDPATMTGIEQPADVTTTVGVAPTLPTEVNAVWSNGDKTPVPVTWEAIDGALWLTPGTFEVKGTAAGMPVTLTVQVAAAASPTPTPTATPTTSTNAPLPTCSEIGHRVYQGNPDYRPDLDSDGDGVGCEDQPEVAGNTGEQPMSQNPGLADTGGR